MLKDRIFNINSSSCSHVFFTLHSTITDNIEANTYKLPCMCWEHIKHYLFTQSPLQESNATFLLVYSMLLKQWIKQKTVHTYQKIKTCLRTASCSLEATPAWFSLYLDDNLIVQAYVPNPGIVKPFLFLPANC